MSNLYIIAIGGSAGSLKPMESFFDHTHIDHASYVIVRHMPKDFHSELKSILQRHARLQLVEATDGMPVLPNKVYISPSQKHMIIKDGKLHFIPILEGPNRAIDIFMESLAKEAMGNKAIAVILSGVGFDGVKGAEAVKNAGGIVIAQEPLSCEHDTMPKYTIKSGIADFVEDPSNMPAVIQKYVQALASK